MGSTSFALTILVSCPFLGMFGAQDPVQAAADGGGAVVADSTIAGLLLEVQTRDDILVLGEPLILSIRLTNVSDRPLVTDGPLRQQGSQQFIQVSFYHRESGNRSDFRSGLWSDLLSGFPVTLMPRQTLECTYWFGANLVSPKMARDFGIAKGQDFVWALPIIGSYDVHVRFEPYTNAAKSGHWSGRIAAPPVTVKVVSPEERGTKDALVIWEGAQQDLSSRGRRQPSPEGRVTCQRLLQAYPDTPYAPFAHYLLGLLEQKGAARARILQDVADLYPAFPLLDQVKYEIAEAIAEGGGDAEAKVNEAIQTNPNHVARIDHRKGL